MSENFDQIVQAAVAETLENMTFMEVLPYKPENPEDPEPVLIDPQGKSLAVVKPVEGDFWLFLPSSLLTVIAESVYVMETDDINEQILQDTLAELLNTLAGKIMQDGLPEDQLFSLGLPKAAEGLQPKPDEEILKKWWFEMQENLFFVSYTGEECPF